MYRSDPMVSVEQQYPSHFEMTHRTWSQEHQQLSQNSEELVDDDLSEDENGEEMKEILVAQRPPTGSH